MAVYGLGKSIVSRGKSRNKNPEAGVLGIPRRSKEARLAGQSKQGRKSWRIKPLRRRRALGVEELPAFVSTGLVLCERHKSLEAFEQRSEMV